MVPRMTDTNSNPTINHDTEARLELLAEQIEGLKAVIARFTEATGRFADGAVALLSGVPQAAPQARKRGRPVGSKNRANAEAAAEKPYHPIAQRAFDLVYRHGKMSQADLARQLSTGSTTVHSSSIAHHMKRAIDEGKIKHATVYPDGRPIVMFYRPDTYPL